LAFSLLFGTLFVPAKVEADFLSSLLFGNDAFAEMNTNTSTVGSLQSGNNSQNIELLQANISSASIFQDPEGKQASYGAGKNNQDYSKIDVSATVNIISDNALMPSVNPLGDMSDTGNGDFSLDQMSVYVVRKGDSISQIAEMFDVSVNTILWANDMKKGAKLVEGDTLLILPISGVQHTITKGETLQSIAKRYKVDVLTITSFNGIEADAKLAVGDELIIPDGQMPNDDVPGTAPKKSGGKTIASNLKSIPGYFINPVPELKRKSQGPHGPGDRGVDLAAPTGTRIIASAEGTVLLARSGWNGGYGDMVTVQHSNGTKTLYAHMSKIATQTGAHVDQGEVIGYVGSTGRSTGPHLHFEVFNAKNPGADWTWAR